MDLEHGVDDLSRRLTYDVFDFDAPLGPLGWVAERRVLERYMRRFLERRMEILETLASGERWRALLVTS